MKRFNTENIFGPYYDGALKIVGNYTFVYTFAK